MGYSRGKAKQKQKSMTSDGFFMTSDGKSMTSDGKSMTSDGKFRAYIKANKRLAEHFYFLSIVFLFSFHYYPKGSEVLRCNKVTLRTAHPLPFSINFNPR
jgi:hypothetical protein